MDDGESSANLFELTLPDADASGFSALPTLLRLLRLEIRDVVFLIGELGGDGDEGGDSGSGDPPANKSADPEDDTDSSSLSSSFLPAFNCCRFVRAACFCFSLRLRSIFSVRCLRDSSRLRRKVLSRSSPASNVLYCVAGGDRTEPSSSLEDMAVVRRCGRCRRMWPDVAVIN